MLQSKASYRYPENLQKTLVFKGTKRPYVFTEIVKIRIMWLKTCSTLEILNTIKSR